MTHTIHHARPQPNLTNRTPQPQAPTAPNITHRAARGPTRLEVGPQLLHHPGHALPQVPPTPVPIPVLATGRHHPRSCRALCLCGKIGVRVWGGGVGVRVRESESDGRRRGLCFRPARKSTSTAHPPPLPTTSCQSIKSNHRASPNPSHRSHHAPPSHRRRRIKDERNPRVGTHALGLLASGALPVPCSL